jgi:hypothetical protein
MTSTITIKRLGAAVAATAAAFALGIGGAGVADAKITPVCTNGGGHEPSGQQDTCNGKGLTETNENPASKAPPGQN